ncbi:MAG: hypothetical protein OEQ18_00685 [Gammaproteobacteria bacterium]|nr:hypothetical protein [Gammaproteobacteria bacterium]
MPRNLTPAAQRSVLARETAETWVILLTIYDPGWAVAIRRVLSRTPFESRGGIFFPAAFRPKLPDQADGESPTWEIEIDNTDQVVLAELKRFNRKPYIWVEEVMASDPDTVQTTTGILRHRIQSYHNIGGTVTCVIGRENLKNEGFPRGRITPSGFPGGF